MMEDNAMQNIENGHNSETVESGLLMQQMLKRMDQQLLFTKWMAFAGCFAAVALVIIAFIVIPPVFKALKSAEEVMNVANLTMQEATVAISAAEDALTNVTAMSDNITETSKILNDFVMDNAEIMNAAIKDIDSIDFQGLNEAISDLQAAVGPFANLMRKFN